MKFRALAGLALACLLLAGCGGGDSATSTTTSPPQAKPRVVTTTMQIGDFVRIIGGDKVDVRAIGGPALDPHSLTPTARDITDLATANLVLKNGAGLETWLDKAFDESDSNAVIADMSNGIQLRTEQISGVRISDPHIWLSVVNARIMVANVTAALVAADPANKIVYESNQRAYTAQLSGLEDEIKQSIARLSNKAIVTSHTSLGYYIEEFGLIDAGSVNGSLKPSDTASQSRITQFASYLRSQNVAVIFGENGFPSSAAASVASAANARLVTGQSALYVDTLGAPGSNADSYVKMMRHNTQSIVSNLG